MEEQIEICTWRVALKKREAERGYEGRFPELVMWSGAGAAHRPCFTHFQDTHLMASVVSKYR